MIIRLTMHCEATMQRIMSLLADQRFVNPYK
jgi:hypothetical protein